MTCFGHFWMRWIDLFISSVLCLHLHISNPSPPVTHLFASCGLKNGELVVAGVDPPHPIAAQFVVKSYSYGKRVPIRNGDAHLWTIQCEPLLSHNRNSDVTTEQGSPMPLVLIHGFASGVGLWVANLDHLSGHRSVFAFDLLGFGRSSRIKFNSDPAIAEREWVESIEDWRKEMKLDKFILLGHSLGGFVASAYALTYPERIRHLILADPWGFPVQSTDNPRRSNAPRWLRTVGKVLIRFNPLASLRAAGPWGISYVRVMIFVQRVFLGPRLVRRFRPDLGRKFAPLVGDDKEAIFDYVYHCNAQHPSGETAFKSMQILGWAKYPMIERLPDLPSTVPLTFIYGSKSWIDSAPGYTVEHDRKNAYNKVELISEASHHVYVDRADLFNECVENIGKLVDENKDGCDDL